MSDIERLTKTSDFKVVGTRPIRPDGVEKVTGRARFGADTVAPGMLFGAILRSPHPHARILSIDASKAEELQGVKAVITAADFADVRAGIRDRLHNVMAHKKALYEGHAIAAVAATDKATAKRALKLIDVQYEVLPHVTDVEEAIKPDAPLVDEDLYTSGVEPRPSNPSNIAARTEFGHGDVEAGFAAADLVIERTFRTEATHQGYIEPHACLANFNSDGSAELWCCTQGHFVVRDTCAEFLGIDVSRLRVTPSEIGGGFGGKTVVYLEPVALALSRKAGRPVKMTMSRAEVFMATGPTASSHMRVKVGVSSDGRITAGDAELYYQTGAYPEIFAQLGAMCAFACYGLENSRAVGYEVLANRPMQAAYRAPGAPIIAFAVESVVDEIARAIKMDPLEFRLKNAARKGDRASYGPVYPEIGLVQALEAAKAHPHYSAQ